MSPRARASCLLALAALVALASCRAEGDARPAPPYALFEGITFEPSACEYDAATDRVLVCSDKDAILYRYRLHDGRLELPRGEKHRGILLPDDALPLKIESMARLDDGTILAATAFDRGDQDFRRLVRFRFALKGSAMATEVPIDAEAITARLRAIDPAIAWWKVEGLATTPGDAALLLGVRSVGRSFSSHDKHDVVWIVRCPARPGTGSDGAATVASGAGAPDLVVRLDAGALGRAEGCSSLERDPRGGYLLLTSWEDEGREDALDAHGAHLFRLPAALLEGAAAAPGKDPAAAPLPAPLRAFTAKAEGLTLLPDGRALVIFDDDQRWKKLFEGYEQSQGLFTVIEKGDLGR